MKVSTTITVEEKTRSMMKTLAQVTGHETSLLWQDAANTYLQRNYASELRKAAKRINSALEKSENP